MASIPINSIITKNTLPHQISDGVTSLLGKLAPNLTSPAVTTKAKLIEAPVHLQPDATSLIKHEPDKDIFGIPRIERLTGLDKIHQNLSSIFEKIRSISKAEAEAMARRYKEILKTEDDTEYTTKLFEQVKQDFGYGDNKNICLTIEDNPEFTNYGSFNQDTGELKIRKNLSRLNIFETMFHEFTHVKQLEIAFRAKGAKKRIEESYIRLFQRERPEAYRSDPEPALAVAREEADKDFEQRKRVFGDLPEFKDESMLNIWGRHYSEADINHVRPEVDYDKYRRNLLEQQAFKNGELAGEIFRQISFMK